MNTQITTLDLDSFDQGADSVVRHSGSRALARTRVRVRPRKLGALIGAIAITPVALVALLTLVLVLLARLLIELAAAGSDG